MTNRIMLEQEVHLGPDASLTEDAELLALAIRKLADEARELAGDAQAIEDIGLDLDEINGFGGHLTRRITITLKTALT